jgi:anoctamin-10
MSFLNNLLELRSDAYKITVHQRRPVPSRTDTIGPWLDALQFLTWAGALTNAALVYLFHPRSADDVRSTALKHDHQLTEDVLGTAPRTPRQLLLSAAAVALIASHGYMAARVLIRRVMERALWKGSKQVQQADETDRSIKENYLRSLGVSLDARTGAVGEPLSVADKAFWERDEGLEEIRKALKDA